MLFLLLFSIVSAAPTDLQLDGSDHPTQRPVYTSDLHRIASDIRGALVVNSPRPAHRYVDKDGNVRIVTSYNSDDSPPNILYKQHQPEDVDSRASIRNPGRKQKYSKKTIKFPEDSDGKTSHEEGSSLKESSYNRQSYEKNLRRPTPVTEDTSIEASGSSYSSVEDDDIEANSGPIIQQIHIGDPSEEHYIVHGHGHGFKKEKGSSYSHAEKGAKGGESTSEHKAKDKYEKGHSEKHGHKELKGGHKEEKGEKSGHLDKEKHYAEGHVESHGGKGSEKGHAKGHKKGHKKKGFRKVHHKDEFKKDEEFFDEELDEEHHKGHTHDHHAHKHHKGGETKKGHHNTGYKEAHKGYEGDKEEGESYKKVKGGANKAGSKHHHGHQAHYHKGAGHKASEAHAHGQEHEEDED